MSRKTKGRKPKSFQGREIGWIKAGQKFLDLDDETYRDFLQCITGYRSAKLLNASERSAVLDAMEGSGYVVPNRTTRRRWPGEPAETEFERRPMLRKVRALLTQDKRPWAYAHGTAEQMFSVTRVEWLGDEQLHKLVAALQIDANRRQTPASITTRKTPPC
jgi:phage gp16-like protein